MSFGLPRLLPALLIPLQSLSFVVQHLPLPVVVTDRDGYVVTSNALAGTVLQTSPGSLPLHLDGHLESLEPSRPTTERSPIVVDDGEHHLVVLGPVSRVSGVRPASPGGTAAEGAAALAGEVAHDFNNLLGVIINYATLAAAEAPEGSQQALDLSEVLAASRRAAEIADRLRRMSASSKPR